MFVIVQLEIQKKKKDRLCIIEKILDFSSFFSINNLSTIKKEK